jgi:hypothetical protein
VNTGKEHEAHAPDLWHIKDNLIQKLLLCGNSGRYRLQLRQFFCAVGRQNY